MVVEGFALSGEAGRDCAPLCRVTDHTTPADSSAMAAISSGRGMRAS